MKDGDMGHNDGFNGYERCRLSLVVWMMEGSEKSGLVSIKKKKMVIWIWR